MADWFTEYFGWMYWTGYSAIFFAAIVASIVALTVLDIRAPAGPRKGWLPMATTRGDRLFLSIMAAIGLHLAWLAFVGVGAPWIASGVATCTAVAIFWKA